MGVELLFNSVEFGVPKQLPADFLTVETRCGREDHTRPRGPSEPPDGVDPNIRRTRKTQRDGHNSGVKIWSLCSVSSTLSHANLEQPFRTLAIKWEVNMLLKKSSCVFLPAFSFLLPFFVRLSVCVYYWVVMIRQMSIYICIFLHESADDNTTRYYNLILSRNGGKQYFDPCLWDTTLWHWVEIIWPLFSSRDQCNRKVPVTTSLS